MKLGVYIAFGYLVEGEMKPCGALQCVIDSAAGNVKVARNAGDFSLTLLFPRFSCCQLVGCFLKQPSLSPNKAFVCYFASVLYWFDVLQ